MNNCFKLEDIKSGYLLVVELNETELFNMTVQYNNLDILGVYGISEKESHWNHLNAFNNSLEFVGLFDKLKIMKIYGRTANNSLLSNHIQHRELLWERKEHKEMTIEEIQKELGYKIKIVEEKQ